MVARVRGRVGVPAVLLALKVTATKLVALNDASVWDWMCTAGMATGG